MLEISVTRSTPRQPHTKEQKLLLSEEGWLGKGSKHAALLSICPQAALPQRFQPLQSKTASGEGNCLLALAA